MKIILFLIVVAILAIVYLGIFGAVYAYEVTYCNPYFMNEERKVIVFANDKNSAAFEFYENHSKALKITDIKEIDFNEWGDELDD